MPRKQEKHVFVAKQPGETPLEALERYRATRPEFKGVPMTYAGRLDPMAEGTLLVLIGDECKNKAKYLALDKEYEVEVVFGISTDTYDALGLVVGAMPFDDSAKVTEKWPLSQTTLDGYVGRFEQEYPPYSSKTVDGKQLHELARAGNLPDEMPTKDVEVYSIESVGTILKYSAAELHKVILAKIALVRGDFRQEEIKKRWGEVLNKSDATFNVIKIKVKCSSGTYMRSLAHKMGKDVGTGAFALAIKRTKIILTK